MDEKKKYIIGTVLALAIFAGIIMIVIIVRENYMSKLYRQYRYPNEAYYGKELYSEIDYKCSDYELEVGNEILNKATAVAEYAGMEQEVENEMGDVGALERYYVWLSPEYRVSYLFF